MKKQVNEKDLMYWSNIMREFDNNCKKDLKDYFEELMSKVGNTITNDIYAIGNPRGLTLELRLDLELLENDKVEIQYPSLKLLEKYANELTEENFECVYADSKGFHGTVRWIGFLIPYGTSAEEVVRLDNKLNEFSETIDRSTFVRKKVNNSTTKLSW